MNKLLTIKSLYSIRNAISGSRCLLVPPLIAVRFESAGADKATDKFPESGGASINVRLLLGALQCIHLAIDTTTVINRRILHTRNRLYVNNRSNLQRQRAIYTQTMADEPQVQSQPKLPKALFPHISAHAPASSSSSSETKKDDSITPKSSSGSMVDQDGKPYVLDKNGKPYVQPNTLSS